MFEGEMVMPGQPVVAVAVTSRLSQDYLVAALYGLSDSTPQELDSPEAVRSMVSEVIGCFGLLEIGRAWESVFCPEWPDTVDRSWLAFCQRAVDEAFGFGPDARSARPARSAGPWRRTAAPVAGVRA
jgi:hypothetical protein